MSDERVRGQDAELSGSGQSDGRGGFRRSAAHVELVLLHLLLELLLLLV